ncbi:MAG TPA: hypothetical protein VD929_01570 [Caulobacteraceae bacterium]|nr:hypothetical protein [Caulobacteraceae bacterium]
MTTPASVLVLAGGRDLIEASQALGRRAPETTVAVAAPCDPRSLNGALSNARAVVMEVDLGLPGALEGFGDLARAAPDGCKLIAAARNAAGEDVRALFRSGASDVLTAPFNLQALSEAVTEALARPAAPAAGKVVAVVKGAGGSGATLVAANLAAALAQPSRKPARPARRTAILDLDLQFGDAAVAFDAQPRHTVLDALKSRARLDASFFDGLLTDTQEGVRLLAAPPSLLPLDAIDAATAVRLVEEARAAHDLTFVDLPAAWTDWTAAVLNAADLVVLVTGATVSGATGARRVLDGLAEIGAPAEVMLVLNRGGGLLDGRDRAAKIARVLEVEAAVMLGEDSAALKAADRGRPVVVAAPSSRLAKELQAAAARLDARLFAPAPVARRI